MEPFPKLLIFLFLQILAFNPAFAVSDTTAASASSSAVAKLSKVLQFKTVSGGINTAAPDSAFIALHHYLESAFPAVHGHLQKEVINRQSLLYTWPGLNPKLTPILLSAHLDVVPVEEATLDKWEHPPFEGKVQDGYIWGRGTMDDKYRVVAILEAVEQLLQEGYQPARTVYLAFGHDEEVGGTAGAGEISAYLQQQGIALEAVFDEGLAVATNVMPGLPQPIAFVGTAAKGNVNLLLEVKGEGGHSSIPSREPPIYLLSKAVKRLHDRPFPARMTPITKETVSLLAGSMGGKYKFAMQHYGLFRGRVLKMLAKDRATGALVRTQMAPTLIGAGQKDNVMPRVATAVINIRILTGETLESVLAHFSNAINDDRVRVTVLGAYTPPSPVTPSDGWTYATLSDAIRAAFPEVSAIVPALFPGGTDAKHYAALTRNIYRFAPLVVDRQEAKRVHNVNERLSVDVFGKCITFYGHLIRQTCGQRQQQIAALKQKPALPVDSKEK